MKINRPDDFSDVRTFGFSHRMPTKDCKYYVVFNSRGLNHCVEYFTTLKYIELVVDSLWRSGKYFYFEADVYHAENRTHLFSYQASLHGDVKKVHFESNESEAQ